MNSESKGGSNISNWALSNNRKLWSPEAAPKICVWTRDVNLDWPVPVDRFHTYVHPSMEFIASLAALPDPPLLHPPFFRWQNKWKEQSAGVTFFGETVDWWWKESRHGGKQTLKGEVMGSHTGSLCRLCANRRFLVNLVCWLVLLIEQVISVTGWLHVISEVLTARQNWDISLIADDCTQSKNSSPVGINKLKVGQ